MRWRRRAPVQKAVALRRIKMAKETLIALRVVFRPFPQPTPSSRFPRRRQHPLRTPPGRTPPVQPGTQRRHDLGNWRGSDRGSCCPATFAMPMPCHRFRPGGAQDDGRIRVRTSLLHPKRTCWKTQAAACCQSVRGYTASEPGKDPEDDMAPGAAGRPDSAACPPDPAFAGCGRFGTRPLTRRANAAYKMSDAAACTLMPFSCAACSRIACDAGGNSNVTRLDLAISHHPLPKYQFVTRCRPCPSSDDTRLRAHSSSCSCSAVIASRVGPPRTGHANPASAS